MAFVSNHKAISISLKVLKTTFKENTINSAEGKGGKLLNQKISVQPITTKTVYKNGKTSFSGL